jgi:hypothetical protein
MSLLAFATAEEGLSEIATVGNVTQSNTYYRGGGYSYKMETVHLGQNFRASITVPFPSRSTIFFQVAIASDALTDQTDLILVAWRSGANIIGCITLTNGSASLKVWTGNKDVQIGTIPVGLPSDGTFIVLEGKVFIDDAAGITQIKYNGNTYVDFTGDTKPGTDTTMDSLIIGNVGAVGGWTYNDDIAIADDQGTSFNSWLNGIKFHRLGITGAGNHAQWTPSAGANYQCVDEVPPSSDDYVSSETTGHRDSYVVANCPGGLTGIHGLAVRYWGEGGGSIKRLLRVDGADYVSADTLSLPGAMNSVFEVIPNNPATGIGWIPADIDNGATEVGMEKV